jgi:hypothetical protein
MPMEPSARLFHCARCHDQVILCRACDRGHVYCRNGCAAAARRESLRRAGARYRGTRRGRRNNAERQRRFRARQQKVTHQGSAPVVMAAVLAVTDTPPQSPSSAGPGQRRGTLICHRCARPTSPFLRHDFLRSTAYRRYPP